jgi:hypothetical protein
MRTSNDVGGYDLTDTPRSLPSHLDGSLHRGNIPRNNPGDEATSYLLPAEKLYLCRFGHRIYRFNHSDPTSRFYKTQGTLHCGSHLLYFPLFHLCFAGK